MMNFWLIEIYINKDTNKIDYAPWAYGKTEKDAINDFNKNDVKIMFNSYDHNDVKSFVIIRVAKELEEEFLNGYYPPFEINRIDVMNDYNELELVQYLDLPNMDKQLKNLIESETNWGKQIKEGLKNNDVN